MSQDTEGKKCYFGSEKLRCVVVFRDAIGNENMSTLQMNVKHLCLTKTRYFDVYKLENLKNIY